MKNYLIIGASSGIGKSLAESLAEAGHRVYGTYAKHPVKSTGKQLSFHFFDVLDDNANLDFLPENLDGIAYCPGSIQLNAFHRIKPDTFVADYKLQVVGAISTIQSALPRLKKSDAASIVLFSTVAVQNGFNFHSLISASKGAVEGLSRALAAEFAPKIRVNCIAPSLTDTPLASPLLNNDARRDANAKRHPLQRTGQAEDIAQMAHFLLTNQSSWITGQIFSVDGGISTIRV